MKQQVVDVTKADYEALAAFRHTLRRFLRFSADAAHSAGVTPQQHQTMLAIKGQPGREWASISEIATALQIKHNAVAGLVNRCVASGLVKRSTSAEDRRQVEVTLTAKGEQILETLSQWHLRELHSLRTVVLRLPTTGDDDSSEQAP